MKYKIIVDKQPRTNPSSEKKTYEIDIEELRYKDDVHDSLIITKDEDYVMRRLSLSEYHVLSVLDTPKKEPLNDINIELFEGDNYIYLMDMTGHRLYIEYLIKNEFNDLYVVHSEMNSAINQTASQIDLSVNKKLEGYSTKEEMEAAIKVESEAITSTVSKTVGDAVDSVNNDIDEKLSKYSTTIQMKSEIKQTADEIKSLITKSVGSLNLLQDSNFKKDNDVTGFWTFMRNYASEEIIEENDSYNWLSMNYLYNSSGATSKIYLSQTISDVSFNDGKYTLSFDYQSDSKNTFSISITATDNEGGSLTAGVNDIELESTTKTQRKVVTFNPKLSEKIDHIDITIIFNIAQWSNIKITKLQFQKGSVATDYSVSQTELYSLIDQQIEKITLEVGKKVDNDDFGTKITQDWQSVQIAWNQISEFIQFINAQLQIKDSSKKLLMALTKDGQYFYNNGTYLGYIGSSQYTQDNSQKGLAFNLNENGKFMSWGKRDTNSGDYYAKLFYCASNSFGNEKEGIYFGVPAFLNSNRLYLTDNTYLQCNNNKIYAYVNGKYMLSLDDNQLEIQGNIGASGNISDGRLKENIQESSINALDVINQMNIRSFDWKKDKKHVNAGFIAQEMEEIDENFVFKKPIKDEDGNIVDNKYYMNELPIVATLVKGMQEQQKEIENLKTTVEKQNTYIEMILKELNIEIPTVSVSKKKSRKINTIKQDYGEIIEANIKQIKPTKIKIVEKDGSINLVEEKGENNG